VPYQPVQFQFAPKHGVVVPGRAGWLLWHQPAQPDGTAVFVKVEPSSRGYGATELVLTSQNPGDVSGATIHAIPFQRLEFALADETRPLVELIRQAWNSRHAPALQPSRFDISSIPSLLATLPHHVERRASRRLSPIPRRGSRLWWYMQLVETHDQVSRRNSRPAAQIGIINGVSAATVRQWLKQARRALADPTLGLEIARTQQRRWHAEIDRRLEQIGLTWDEYCDQHDTAAGTDPVGAWNLSERETFLHSTLADAGKSSV
jgi:hypothetical protein